MSYAGPLEVQSIDSVWASRVYKFAMRGRRREMRARERARRNVVVRRRHGRPRGR